MKKTNYLNWKKESRNYYNNVIVPFLNKERKKFVFPKDNYRLPHNETINKKLTTFICYGYIVYLYINDITYLDWNSFLNGFIKFYDIKPILNETHSLYNDLSILPIDIKNTLYNIYMLYLENIK